MQTVSLKKISSGHVWGQKRKILPTNGTAATNRKVVVFFWPMDPPNQGAANIIIKVVVVLLVVFKDIFINLRTW